MSNYSLFNSADDCLAYSLSEPKFSEGLLLNILFQEGLLLHEAYFFNSTLLAQHLACAKRGTPSLFEQASRSGLIIPAFRDPNTETLDQAYSGMKTTYGDSYQISSPQMQAFRDRIVASVDIGLRITKPFYWPTDKGSVGQGYQRLIHDLLQTEQHPECAGDNPDREQLILRLWEASKPWRFDLIEQAVHRTQTKGALGLQRMELLCSLGWSVGIPKDVVNIRPEDIIQSCADPEQQLAMEVFLKWITQCHHLNQAEYFGTATNFPVYDLAQDFIPDTVLRSRLDPSSSPSEGFRCQVELPPLDALLRADATDLLAIRCDLGVEYLYVLRRWQDKPTIDNQEVVKASLQRYCGEICARYNVGIRQALRAQGSQRTREVVDTVSGIAGVLTGIPLGLFLLFTRKMRMEYRYVKSKPRMRDVEITLPSSG